MHERERERQRGQFIGHTHSHSLLADTVPAEGVARSADNVIVALLLLGDELWNVLGLRASWR